MRKGLFVNFFSCLWTTVVIWGLARFVPAILSTIDPDSALLKIFTFVIMLPIGWAVSRQGAGRKHPRCIRTSLYLFAFIETGGIFTAITYLLHSLSLSTGRYATDMYGIPYENYPIIFGILIPLEILYIFLCFFLAKKTVNVDPNSKVELEGEQLFRTGKWEEGFPVLAEPYMPMNTLMSFTRDEDGDLVLKMKDGSEYCYYDFPENAYLEMKSAVSAESFFHRHIKGKYQCEKISESNKSDERRRLVAEIAKLKRSLREHDNAVIKNKEILNQTYSDEELRLMVDRGEVSAESAEEYISQRESLKLFVNNALWMRETMVKMIGDLAKQLAELECKEPYLGNKCSENVAPPINRGDSVSKSKVKNKTSSSNKLLWGLSVIFFILLITASVIFGSRIIATGNIIDESALSAKNSTESLETVVRPRNGQIVKYPRSRRTVQIAVDTHTKYDQADYYFAFVPVGDSKSVIDFYVHYRSSAEILIPPGEYEIYFASGETWNGTESLFGPDTVYSKIEGAFFFAENEVNENLKFFKDNCIAIGYNVKSKIISEDIFPK